MGSIENVLGGPSSKMNCLFGKANTKLVITSELASSSLLSLVYLCIWQTTLISPLPVCLSIYLSACLFVCLLSDREGKNNNNNNNSYDI